MLKFQKCKAKKSRNKKSRGTEKSTNYRVVRVQGQKVREGDMPALTLETNARAGMTAVAVWPRALVGSTLKSR